MKPATAQLATPTASELSQADRWEQSAVDETRPDFKAVCIDLAAKLRRGWTSSTEASLPPGKASTAFEKMRLTLSEPSVTKQSTGMSPETVNRNKTHAKV